jgi:hypothetical protein
MISRYAAFVASSLLVLLPLHLPYYQLKRQWDISSSLEQCIYYSSDLLLSYVTVPDFMNDLYFVIFGRGSESNLYEKLLFPSLVLPLLIVLGGALRRAVPLGARLQYISRSCWAVLISSFHLSLGPGGASTHSKASHACLARCPDHSLSRSVHLGTWRQAHTAYADPHWP